MKNLLLLAATIVMTLTVSAQYNQPVEPFTHYCKHQQQYHHQKEYMQFESSHPLLDQYDMKFFFLDLHVENNTTDLEGNVTINSVVTAPVMDTFALELVPEMTVDSLFINDELHSVVRDGDYLLVPLNDQLLEGDDISAQVYYQGTPPSGSFFVGVTTDYSSTWDKHVTWTLSEPYNAKQWWPTKQDLMDKADSSWVFLTTDENNLAGSQGLLTAVTPMPDDKLRFEWKSSYPIVYYLISFAVAEYQEYNTYAYPEGHPDSILIQNYIYDSPGCLEYYQDGMDATGEMIELFSDLYIMYPFEEEKYGHCLSELGGGMEHQTMSTMGNFGFGLVAHELGHMWFGDNVTCATWSDIYINEGWATYTDYLANEYIQGYAAAQNWLTARHSHVKSAPGGSIYVPEEELGNVWRIFDGRLSYSKGAIFNHMLRWEINDDDLFYEACHDFQEQYTDSSATGMELKEVFEDVTGMDFTDFFDQWYFGEGYPIYDITWNQDNDSLYLTSTQTTSTSVTTLFKMTIPVYVEFEDGTDTTYRVYQDQNLQNFSIAINQPVEEIGIDPEQWILHHLNSLLVVLEEIKNPVHFTVGPNPFKDKLNLFFSHDSLGDVKVVITDLTGRKIMDETMSGTSQTLHTGSLPGGIYLINVSDGENQLTKKLLKK